MTTCQDILGSFHEFHREHFKNYSVEKYEKESRQLIQPILDNLE